MENVGILKKLLSCNLTIATTPKTKNVNMFLILLFVKTVNDSCICEKYTCNTCLHVNDFKMLTSVEGKPNLRFHRFFPVQPWTY